MTTNALTNAVLRGNMPAGLDGQLIEPEARFDAWDDSPHAYFIVPVTTVQLADIVFGGTHQVDGIGQANQRGVDARRLDLSYVVGPSLEATARAIVPIDQVVEVKRYLLTPGHRWAWMKLPADGDRSYKAGLVPDYGSQTELCCGASNVSDDINTHGYETSQTACDDCIDSWRIDHAVVRHEAPKPNLT